MPTKSKVANHSTCELEIAVQRLILKFLHDFWEFNILISCRKITINCTNNVNRRFIFRAALLFGGLSVYIRPPLLANICLTLLWQCLHNANGRFRLYGFSAVLQGGQAHLLDSDDHGKTKGDASTNKSKAGAGIGISD